VQSVEYPQVAEVALELLVVEVVEVGLLIGAEAPGHAEARVMHLRVVGEMVCVLGALWG